MMRRYSLQAISIVDHLHVHKGLGTRRGYEREVLAASSAELLAA
jgi:hypothetical protein